MSTNRKVFVALVGLDILAVLFAFNLFSVLRGLSAGDHLIVTPFLAPVLLHLFAIYLIDGYSARTDMMSLDYTSQHTIALVSAMLVTLMMTFVIIPAGFELQSSRSVIALSYLLLMPLTLAYRRVIHQRNLRAHGLRTIIFLGDAEARAAFRAECERIGIQQKVQYAATAPTEEEARAGVHAFADLLATVETGALEVEAIVLRETNRELPHGASQKLVRLYFRGVPTYTLELFHQVYWRKIPLYRLNQTWLFQEGFRTAREPVFERLKRVSDILFALVGLVLAAPFILTAAAAVWLEDRGPVFFSQNRVGRNHRIFRLHKLRSMRVSTTPGDRYTQPGDRRITRVGRFLRATRIDEFPQLWNVLRGDMSLIGPRAEWDVLVENYEREIPCYYFRHLVKPGITGWAQVNYPYGASTEDTLRKLEYDLYYIRYFSFRLDASIVLKTVHIMLFGKGR
jgi:exopolysaccharide biosynthesis polyprenyl glycosylphosphotransferase